MRTFRIDFTQDRPCIDGCFMGRIGEHNATEVVITPPAILAENKATTNYVIAFATGGMVIHSEPLKKAETVTVPLWQQLTKHPVLGIQLEAYDDAGEFIGKSEYVSGLRFLPSADGNDTPADTDNPDFVSLYLKTKHFHENKETLDKFSEDESGNLMYDEKPIEGSGSGAGLTDKQAADLEANTAARHTHDNKEILDKFGINDANTRPTFDTGVVAFQSDVAARMAEIQTNIYRDVYKKTEVEKYVIAKVNEAISAQTHWRFELVESLPETGAENIIYLVPNASTGENVYDEYIFVNEAFEIIGNTAIDMSNCVTKGEFEAFISALNASSVAYSNELLNTVSGSEIENVQQGLDTMLNLFYNAVANDIEPRVKELEQNEYNPANKDILARFVDEGELLYEGEAVAFKKDIPEGGTGGSGSNVTIDPTLTIEGSAADAKATGDRLLGVEYQTVTTEEAYEHKDLPEGEKTVMINGDGSWGDTSYVCTGEDLVLRESFAKSFPYNGITITKEDYVYHVTGTSTATTTIFLGDSDGNTQISKIKDLNGQTLKLLTFADKILESNIRIQYQFYGADGASLSSAVKKPIASNTTSGSADIVVPNGAEYMTIALLFLKDVTFDDKIQFYLSLSDSFLEDVVVDDSVTAIMTMPYPSVVGVSIPLNQYIEYIVNNTNSNEQPAVNGSATYLTPEDFGAVGNGTTDDSAAIEACLAKAGSSRNMVIMAKKYYVSTPIKISQQGLYLLINDIKYDGNESAVVITGKRNTIKIHSITSASTALTFGGAEASSAVMYNDVEVNNISSGLHGIVFDAETASMYQNTVKFNSISANGSGCYGIAYLKSSESTTTLGENNFYGGQISKCEWACYKIGGNSKFYGIHIEDEVQGGFYIETGCTIFHPRIAESMRDGNLPIYKFINTSHTTIYDSSGIYINQIDLTEAENTFTTDAGNVYCAGEYNLGTIYGRVIGSNIADTQTANVSCVYSTKTYLWGKYLIFTPHMNYQKEITEDKCNTRKIGTETSYEEISELPQLPTKFIVNTIDTNVYLHPSYCAFGISEFEVEQLNGFTCKIYGIKSVKDENNNFVDEDFVIFDGSTQGDGVYSFKVYKENAGIETALLRSDFTGHYWNVEKVISETDVETALEEAKASGEFDGVGIASVEQTTTSSADNGVNVITVTLTDGTTSAFEVRNGSKGSTGASGGTASEIEILSKSGSYWNIQGKEVATDSISSKYTNIIPVTEGQKYIYTGYGASQGASILWYSDAAGSVLLSYEQYNDGSTGNAQTVVVTVPTGAKSARFCSYSYSTPVLSVSLYEEETETNLLSGKKIVYDGDSICAGGDGSKGYSKIIAEKTGGSYVNQAVGGARLTTRTDGGHSIVDNLVNLPTDGDLYCFEGGINDFWNLDIHLGTCDTENLDGELDTTTVCGALETIFRYALNNFIGKPICFVITHKIQTTAFHPNDQGKNPDKTFKDFRDAMVSVCEKYSIPYYDAFNESGLNGWNAAQNEAFMLVNDNGVHDGCHPNEEGYKRYYVPQLISLFERIMPRE